MIDTPSKCNVPIQRTRGRKQRETWFYTRVQVGDCFKILARLLLKMNNEIITPFFVITNVACQQEKLAKKTTSLVYTWLIYNKLLGYTYMWILGNNFSLLELHNVISCKDIGEHSVLFSIIHQKKTKMLSHRNFILLERYCWDM